MQTNITKREKKSKHRDGRVSAHTRWVLHYKDPATEKRRQRYFNTRKEAEAARNDLIKNQDAMKRRKGGVVPTLGEAAQYWLDSKKSNVMKSTHSGYTQVTQDYILGPALKCSPRQKFHIKLSGKVPSNIKQVEMLGAHRKIDKITTAEIRSWFNRVLDISGTYNARVAKKQLSSIFRLIEEDYEIRLARMPTRPGPPHRRKSRKLLTEEQIKIVLQEASRDKRWGAYYAFLFLTGVRPSEMLALLWDDVDLDKGRVHICRTQDCDANIKDKPKTDAGVREIPLNSFLLGLMKEWKERCPTLNGKLYRVFPSQRNEFGKGRQLTEDSDGGLSINNFRTRVWYPLFDRLNLPRITTYAARHMAISFLQSQGVEIGLVAKIAGHSSPNITLQYYTHAVSETDGVMDQLNTAYGLEDNSHDTATRVQI